MRQGRFAAAADGERRFSASGNANSSPTTATKNRPPPNTTPQRIFRLFVDLASVRDPRHIDGSGRVVNDVDDPVITDTNPPFVIAALECLAARRPRSRRQTFETRHNAGNHFRGQPMQFSFRACS